MLKKTSLLLCLTLLFSVAANAASPLTSDDVERVLATFEALEQHTDNMNSENDQTDSIEAEMFDPSMFQKECRRMYDHSNESAAIIKEHGFTAQSWTDTAGRVLKAFAYLSTNDERNSGLAEMKSAIEQIKNDPSIPAEQKKMMLQQYDAVMTAAKTMMKTPKEDVEAVKPYYNKFLELDN